MDKRVAIVTGAGTGIGAAAARELAGRGMTVAVVGRTRSTLDEVATDLARGPGAGFALVDDLSLAEAPARVVAQVLERTGRLDVIVNNAAHFRLKHVHEFTVEDFDAHVAVNVRAPYFLVQAALPALRDSPSAAVVNVSSAAAVMYRPRQTVYGLTKAAVEHLTKNLAAELAPFRIRVNCLRPGPADTPIHRQAVGDPDARIAELGQLVPLGRVGRPDELAWWIGNLVDPRAEWVTGAVFVVDGGRTLGPPESA
ncbi:MAG TPA: SDR family oxidoreductase [Gaiellaceae bacterium]|nr:SDR family oxidoreductase [Gaiellaceae bacterium]